jgi:hypothetical protein
MVKGPATEVAGPFASFGETPGAMFNSYRMGILFAIRSFE